ncbi:MAG: adaptor protein MecA [Clostridiales bacterium]|jgi:adapter protein MecA 1/2|nr:adaptor protein MecA [Clostridiales bacterium]
MQVERISENQLKITISRAELDDRSVDLAEIANKSEKMNEFIRDMAEEFLDEFSFRADSQLMIEAGPASEGSMMIIITKMSAEDFIDDEEDDEQDCAECEEQRRCPSGILSELMKVTEMMKSAIERQASGEAPAAAESTLRLLFSFESLDDVSRLCARVNGVYKGESSLYKLGGRYYLLARAKKRDCAATSLNLSRIFSEYARKHSFTDLSEEYLTEHGEVITPRDAVEIMAALS